ncbi:MAG: hypothetical protein JRG79_15870 [Deltaproteobacteria bacterium]|nr:hypothetical protein [Deltaproteobacteria bacterium]
MTKENYEIRMHIFGLERQIDEMHLDFERYRQGLEPVMPAWEKLELDLIWYSRRRLYDFELSSQMDRVLYKFQNRKKIWLRWVEEYHQKRKEEEEEEERKQLAALTPELPT